MKINERCLPCLIDQVIRTANLTKAENREELYRNVFARMSQVDFNKTNPEINGQNYQLIKQHLGCDDPYRQTKAYYNQLFLSQIDAFDEKIRTFEDAIKYAIVANIIDFSPAHSSIDEDISRFFSNMDDLTLTVDDIASLRKDLETAGTLLYLGDNCGEICFDMLLIKRIRELYPQCRVYFGVRGEAVVNDNTVEDACAVGMDRYATVISNGDCSLGTVLPRTSPEFRAVFDKADVVIAKGQANYESLSDIPKNTYFLLMTKCAVIAQYVGVPEKSLVCVKSRCQKN